MEATVLPADDLELLWSRIFVEVDLRQTPSQSACCVHGTAHLWVAPRISEARDFDAFRLHCRQCEVTAVTVNGSDAKWELLDPHERIVCNDSLNGSGDVFDATQRAAFMAAAEGELVVIIPRNCENFEAPQDTSDSTRPSKSESEAWAQAARSHALAQFSSKLSVPHALRFHVEVKYNLDNPCGGFRLLNSASGEPSVMYTSGGGAYGSCVGVDYDGARCRWPCLDGAHAHHQAPVELVITSRMDHSVVASGQRVSTIRHESPRWIHGRGKTTAEVFTTSEWFVGPRCPHRGVGFVLGVGLRRFSSVSTSPSLDGAAGEGGTENDGENDIGQEQPPVISQWVVASEDNEFKSGGVSCCSAESVAHAVTGLDAAALFVGDLLGVDFPAPTHSQVWLPCDRDGSLAEDTLVFANLTLVSARLALGVRHSDPQLPSHLAQLRAAILAWLLPLWRVRHAAADGWLAPGFAGWLVLCWIERVLGSDASRLALQRLHDSVVARERGPFADAPPVSRGASFACGRPVALGCPSASQDPLLLGPRALNADVLLGVHAKATLVFHMMEKRVGETAGREAVLRAASVVTAPAVDALLAPRLEEEEEEENLRVSARVLDASFSENAPTATLGQQQQQQGAEAEPGALSWSPSTCLCTRSFFDLVNGEDEAAMAANAEREWRAAPDSSLGGEHNAAAAIWLEQWVYGSGSAAFFCEWEWDKTKNEVQVTLKQVVHQGRSKAAESGGGSSSSPHAEGGGGGGGAFQGPILIRVVEVNEVVMDHRRVLGSELLHKFSLKCQTSTKASHRRRAGFGAGGNSSSHLGAAWGTSGPTDSDSSVCPVLWIKVDPDYSWAREVIFRKQPFESWLEQLGKDGDADARVCALRAIAEHPAPDEPHRQRRPAAALLADVVRGAPLPLSGGDVAAEEPCSAVRAEAADALARWQIMHAPRTGVANLAGSWAGLDGLSTSLGDLFEDERCDAPVPLGTRVVGCSVAAEGVEGEVLPVTRPASGGGGCTTTSTHSGGDGGGGDVVAYPSSFASANLHVSLLEAVASVRAKNGATPLAAATVLLKALEFLDDDHYPPMAPAAPPATHSPKAKKQRTESSVVDSGTVAMDTGTSMARVLVAVSEVFLFHEEVHANAEEWRRAALAHACRLLRADQSFRGSHNAVVSAASLQTIASLSVQVGSASAPPSWASVDEQSVYLKPWGESGNPDSVRLVGLVGTVQQHTASGNPILVLDALNWFLAQLFGDADGGGVRASDWLRVRATRALADWLSASNESFGGVLTREGGLLFVDQYMPGLAGRSPSTGKSFYSPGTAALKPSHRQQELARRCRDMVRGAVGYTKLSSLPLQQQQQQTAAAAEPVHPSAEALCARMWNLANSSSEIRYDQRARNALRDLWTVLLPHDVPHLMRSTVGGSSGLGSSLGTPSVVETAGGMQSWTPGVQGDRGVVEGLLSHARVVRELDRRRAKAGSWLDEQREEGIAQPKHRVRLVVNSNAN